MTTNNPNEYLDYIQPPSAGGELAQLQELATQQARLEAIVAKIENDLSIARENLRDLAERQLPELMDQVGMSELKTDVGLTVKVSETIRASITKAKAPYAFEWLRENGHGSLIKRQVSVTFGKGEDEKAEALREELVESHYHPDEKVTVHASTLSSFVREKLEAGEDLPLDLLGVHRQRIAKLS